MLLNPTRVRSLAVLTSLVFLGGCAGAFNQIAVKGSGVAKTEQREVQGFSAVEISGVVQLDCAVGSETKVELTTDDNLLPLVTTQVEGETLKIALKENISTGLGIKAKVTVPALTALTASGATRATVTGVTGKSFKLNVNGASNVTVSGKADRLEVDCAGASHVHAFGLPAQFVTARVSGASQAEVHADEELNADASGASSITYEGAPAKKAANTSGVGKVNPK
jgi:hypothetical protein